MSIQEGLREVISFVFYNLDIQINNESPMSWDDCNSTVSGVTLTKLTDRLFQVKMDSDVTLQISRTFSNVFRKYYLGIFITHSDGFSDHAEGVIGE